jgi:hypothetical protein
MLFVIFCFSKEHVESLVRFIEGNLPFLHKALTDSLEKQRALLKDPSHFTEGEKPLIAKAWDYFILSMIAFFVVSIINSLVAQHLVQNPNAKVARTAQPRSHLRMARNHRSRRRNVSE